MKIIKKGKVMPLEEDMIAECPKCECVFTFVKNESNRSCSNNGGGYVYFAFCPECTNSNCAFDTGYPGNSDGDREANRSVRERQARLRSLIQS